MVDGQRCILVLPVYVDDLLPMGDKVLTDEFESYIGNYYQVSVLGDANHFLGIRIERNRESRTLSLDQVKYVDRIMSAIAGDNLPDFPTPMSNQVRLVKSTDEVDEPTKKLYQMVIGSVMYLMLGTCPDLAHAVGVLARFSSNPSHHHTNALSRLLGYIQATKRRYLFFHPDEESVDPVGYTDADFAGDKDGSKSTSGYTFLIHGATFSWRSKLQSTVAGSTMEAEYIALYHASLNAVWIRNFLQQIGLDLSTPLPLYCDNNPALNVAMAEAPHAMTKHFDVKWHIVRQHIKDRVTNVIRCSSEENKADVFTKALGNSEFMLKSSDLGLNDLPASPNPDVSNYEDAEEQ